MEAAASVPIFAPAVVVASVGPVHGAVDAALAVVGLAAPVVMGVLGARDAVAGHVAVLVIAGAGSAAEKVLLHGGPSHLGLLLSHSAKKQ